MKVAVGKLCQGCALTGMRSFLGKILATAERAGMW